MSAAESSLIFISYSHDSDEHQEKVLGLAGRLRQDGLDAQLDQYVNGTPEQGWPRWMLDRLDEAAFVLVVCTATYYRRFRGHEAPGRGRGVDWEGALITQEVYDARSRTARFVPVLFAAGQERFIPEPLRGHTHYELTSEEGYQELYRFLLGQAGVEPIPLGEIRPILPKAAKSLSFDPEPGPSAAAGGSHRLFWLALPTLILLPLIGLSTFWHVPTRVRLEVATARLALTLGGGERREILNASAPVSSLIIEDCSMVSFAAETLEVADPRQLVPGTGPQVPQYFPAAAWRALSPPRPVKLPCSHPEAKLTLKNPDSSAEAGALDHVLLDPGSQVVLEVSPDREPAVSLEIATPQDLHLPWEPALELVAEFVEPKGITVPFQGFPLTWRARLPEAHRTIDVTSGERGLVLIVTPTRGQAAAIFPEKLDLPLTSLEMLEENLIRGNLISSIRGTAKLSYPDHPEIPAVTIETNEDLGLGGLSQARLTSLVLDAGNQTLHVGFDGKAGHAASRAGAFVRDHRLTLFHTVRYSWRWALIAATAVWLVSTSWAAFVAWKKLQE